MKYLDIIQHEFMDKSASILLFTAKPKQKVKPKLKAKVKPKGGYVKKERVGPSDFLQAMGDREVTNPDPKAKKTKIKIKSLKAAQKGSPQNRLYIQLYKQWKGTGSAGVKAITTRDKAIATIREKLKQQKEKLTAKKPDVSKALEKANAALKAEREKFKKYKEEQKAKTTEKKTVVKTQDKSTSTVDKENEKVIIDLNTKSSDTEFQKDTREQIDKLKNVGDVINKQYTQTIETITQNKDGIYRSLDILNDPPPPAKSNIQELQNIKSDIDRSLSALDVTGAKFDNVINAAGIVSFKLTFDNDKDKIGALDKLVSNKGVRNIRSILKNPNIQVTEDQVTGTIDIQVPKQKPDIVSFKELAASKAFQDLANKPESLPIIVGKDQNNEPIIWDLDKVPHGMIVGTSQSGKSVATHSFINSIMFGKSPEQAQLILIDCARGKEGVEFSTYENSRYLARPVAKTVQDASDSLDAVDDENSRRAVFLQEMSKHGLKFANCSQWNKFIGKDPSKMTDFEKNVYDSIPEEKRKLVPTLTVVIDEAKDVFSKSNPKANELIMKVSHLLSVARSNGIHLTLCSQSPSREAIPGELQTNLLGRVIFKLVDSTDAEKVNVPQATNLQLGGDGYFMVGQEEGTLKRIRGAYLDDKTEVPKIVEQVKGPQRFIEDSVTKPQQQKQTQVEEDVKKTIQEAEEKQRQLAEFKKSLEKPTTADAAESYLKKRQEDLKRQIREKENIRKKMLAGQPTAIDDEPEEDYEPAMDSTEINIPEESSISDDSSVSDDVKKEIDEMTKPVPVEKVTKPVEETTPKTETKPIEPERKKSLLDKLKKLFKKD